MDKGNCFCGNKAIGLIGIPMIQLTESSHIVNVGEGEASVIIPLCAYHSVFAEKGFLKSDGNKSLIPQPFLKHISHTNQCLLNYLKENKGKKGIAEDRFMIDIILEARYREEVYPEYLKAIEGENDIIKLIEITKKMFKVPKCQVEDRKVTDA